MDTLNAKLHKQIDDSIQVQRWRRIAEEMPPGQHAEPADTMTQKTVMALMIPSAVSEVVMLSNSFWKTTLWHRFYVLLEWVSIRPQTEAANDPRLS